jgi:hypothetical protein
LPYFIVFCFSFKKEGRKKEMGIFIGRLKNTFSFQVKRIFGEKRSFGLILFDLGFPMIGFMQSIFIKEFLKV